MAVAVGAHNEEEYLGNGAVEDLCLLFWKGTVCVVVAYGEEVFARQGFCGFTKVFREFYDDTAGVFLHSEGYFAGGGVVNVHAEVFMFFAAGDVEVAVNAV